jgi:hypothetical protein
MWLIVVIAVGVVVAVGANLGVGPLVRVRGGVERGLRVAGVYVRQAPLTFLYLLIVVITTWTVLTVSPHVGDQLLVTNSSTLRVLTQEPLRGLVQSAFWLETPVELVAAVLFAVVLAPVERWLGSFRWLLVAAAGHLGATIAVAIVIWASVQAGWADASATGGVDVGVSYAFGAVAGVLTWRLEGRRRLAYAVGLEAVLLAVLIVHPAFTGLGHMLAVAIGLAFAPFAGEATVRARAVGPIYPRPWRALDE